MREMAAVLGVHVMTLQRWEKGVITPRGENAIAYADLLERLDRASRR
jgi:DNA-binding transcriptional regulator YiaG